MTELVVRRVRCIAGSSAECEPVPCSVEAAERAVLDMAAGGERPSPAVATESIGPAMSRTLAGL